MTDEQITKMARGVALFDFDGTIIPWDTQVIFANHVLKQEGWRRFYLALFAAMAPFAPVLGDEGMKRVFLSYLWQSKPSEVRAWARAWAEEWVPTRCYSEVLARLERHRAAGQLTVLVSASPEFYVREVGRLLGFDLALGTVVELEPSVSIFPDLKNNKSSAKTVRIERALGATSGTQWTGYTDSTADLPMMKMCNSGVVINPSDRLTRIAAEMGWEILRPSVPWDGKLDKWKKIAAFACGV